MLLKLLYCGFLTLDFYRMTIGQIDVSLPPEGELPPDGDLPPSVTLNPIPAVEEYCPFLLNCTVSPSQKGISVVQLLKLQHKTWNAVFIYDSKRQELQFIQVGVQYIVAPPIYVVNVTATLSDAGMYLCQANDSSGVDFYDSKNVTVTGVTDGCSALCQNGAKCIYGCQTHTCVCAINWKGETCEDACVNARTVRNASDVILGSNVTIACAANSKSSAVFWSRTSTDFNISSVDKLTQSGTLTIVRALAEDAGLYYCYVNSGNCVTRQKTFINVLWDMPPTTAVAEDLQKTEGENLDLLCNVTTRPPALLYWRVSAGTLRNDMPSKTSNCRHSSASPSSSASSFSASSSGNITSLMDVLLCDLPTTTTAAPAIIGNKTRGLSRLHIKSLTSVDSGLYKCYAELPGEMTFILAMYSVLVRPAVAEEPDSSSKTSPDDKLPELWTAALIVYGIMLACVGIFVASFIFKRKCDNKKGPQVTPVCDEADTSCNTKAESSSEDVSDGDDIYNHYEQDEAPAGNRHSQVAGQSKQQRIEFHLNDLPPLHTRPQFLRPATASGRQDWDCLPPLNNRDAGLAGNAVGASSHYPLKPDNSGKDGASPSTERRRRRKVIRE